MKRLLYLLLVTTFLTNCQSPVSNHTTTKPAEEAPPFLWKNANIYFLLTDRFYNGDPTNDVNFDRNEPAAVARNMMGGDLQGVIKKLQEGYFQDLGITAIWFTPVVEQNRGIVDEGTGNTYPYHGYWAQDWTALDPNFGTEEDLATMVKTAHRQGIRVLFDVVINHTGPVTAKDPVWPDEWVRTSPACKYEDYASTVHCTLVENLPDVKTESDDAVELPPQLLAKWKAEGRLETELAELDDFFTRTGYPRAPRFYIIKWLTDYVRDHGIDGYRVDTAKHIEETVWNELKAEAKLAFAEWKSKNPEEVLDENEFYMLGEVYNYNIASDRDFSFGDQTVDYFDHGFNSLINFGFKYDCTKAYDSIFVKYSAKLQGPLQGKSVVNYISSHDDSQPFDKNRQQSMVAATKLLLCPGAAQVYYGDETARSLVLEGAEGDANLRSFMNWEEIEQGVKKNGVGIPEILSHWQKLGQFRKAHPAVGAGIHETLSSEPYFFKRTIDLKNYSDQAMVGLDLSPGEKTIPVEGVFAEGQTILDYYSGQTAIVNNGKIKIDSEYTIVLLGG